MDLHGGASSAQATQQTQLESLVQEPDAAELRAIRTELRQQLDSLRENREELTKPGSEYLVVLMKTLHRKFEGIRLGSVENKLFGEVMSVSAQLAHAQAQRVSAGGRVFDADQFMRKMASFMGTAMDWDKIGRVASRHLQRTPTVDFLLGPLEIQVKERKRGEVRRLNASKIVSKPKKLDEKEREEIKDETTINVRKVYEYLQRKSPINYFQFVVNPTSFAQTVENIFYVSFLVRDGRARLEIVHDQPLLSLGDEVPKLDKNQMNKQLIMDITETQWRELVHLYNIGESAIPTRSVKK